MMMFFKVNSNPNTCASYNDRCDSNYIHSKFISKHVQFLIKKYAAAKVMQPPIAIAPAAIIYGVVAKAAKPAIINPVAMFLKPSAKNLTCSFSVNNNLTFTKGVSNGII